MRLNRLLRSSLAAIVMLGLIAPSGLAEGPPAVQRAPGSALGVNVAQSSDFSRIEFRFPGGAHVTTRRDGQKLILHFSRYMKPDMTRLRVDPPRFLKAADDRNAGGLEITLTLADGADAKVGEGDGVIAVNLFAAEDPAPAQAQPQATANRPNPVPDGGVVKVLARQQAGQLVLDFPWKAPLGAAVFHRGGALWIVFDAAARLDLSALPHGSPLFAAVAPVQGPDYTALRFDAPAGESVAASAQGADWTVTLAGSPLQAPDQVKIARDDESATGALQVTMAGSTHVFWVGDPTVGDRIGVVTALAPAKGLAAPRQYVDLALFPSANGLALQPIADDLLVTTDGDLVTIGRPTGLALSKPGGADARRRWPRPAAAVDAPRAHRLRRLVEDRRRRLRRTLRRPAGGRGRRGRQGQGGPDAGPHGPRPLPGRLGTVVRGDRPLGPERQGPAQPARRSGVPRFARRRQGDGRALQGGAGRVFRPRRRGRSGQLALARLRRRQTEPVVGRPLRVPEGRPGLGSVHAPLARALCQRGRRGGARAERHHDRRRRGEGGARQRRRRPDRAALDQARAGAADRGRGRQARRPQGLRRHLDSEPALALGAGAVARHADSPGAGRAAA